jgi:type III pantothenate kinase
MSDLFLTVDLGNSRCKLRLWADGAAVQPLRGATFETQRGGSALLLEQCERWLAAGRPPQHGALSAVGSPQLEQELRARLESRVLDGCLRTPDPGLELDVRSAHTVGRDRLFAARGAAEIVTDSALVLDAGTALTVDALERRAGRPVFRGGAIAAGPHLIAAALSEHGARLPRFEPRPGAHALGRDTGEALSAGAVVGFRGAARELVAEVAREAGLADAVLVLTGGARSFLLDPPLFAGRNLHVVEDLVHLGLLAALRDELAAQRAQS